MIDRSKITNAEAIVLGAALRNYYESCCLELEFVKTHEDKDDVTWRLWLTQQLLAEVAP